MSEKYTETELLRLAGKLAISCRALLEEQFGSSENCISNMKQCLDDYDNAIFSNLKTN